MRESVLCGEEDKACPEPRKCHSELGSESLRSRIISVGEGENVVAPFMVHYKKRADEDIRANSSFHS